MAVTWNESDPADTDIAFPDVAGEVRQVYSDLREMLNTMLDNNALTAPPATIATYDSQIPTPGPAVVPAPLQIRGDKVNLRGMTWRKASVTDVASRSTTSTTFSPVGNPGGAAGTGAFNITITPVSSSSLLEFHYMMFARSTNLGGAINNANPTRRGEFRIFNVTGAAEIANARGVCVANEAGLDGRGFSMIQGYGQTTGISGATQFEVQFATKDAANTNTLAARGDLITSVFTIIESV